MSRAVKQAEFARILNVSRSTVTRARQAGRLVTDERGRVLVDESLQRYHETAGGRTDVAERHAEARGVQVPGASEAADAGANGAAAGEGDTAEPVPGSRKHYQAEVLRYENLGIRLEQALRRHERYQRADVRREAQAVGGTLRAAMERLVDETAPQLVIATPEQRRELLQRRSREIRRVLKSEMARAMYRLRVGGGRS